MIDKERHGDYLGSTIQVIPHVTNEIQNFIVSDLEDEDFASPFSEEEEESSPSSSEEEDSSPEAFADVEEESSPHAANRNADEIVAIIELAVFIKQRKVACMSLRNAG